VYPALAYVLGRLPALKKRAYVARYLLPVEVPPEFQHDEAVSSLLAEYRALQGDFKNTHKGRLCSAARGCCLRVGSQPGVDPCARLCTMVSLLLESSICVCTAFSVCQYYSTYMLAYSNPY
jgi:hypothetical protein